MIGFLGLGDWLLKAAASLMGFLLNLLPPIHVGAFVASLASVWSVVRPYAGFANYFAPLDVVLPALLSLFALRGALLVWYAANWLYSKVPMLGH